MPRRLALSSSSFSSASSVGSGFGEPSSRNKALLLRIADFSNVPPTPTPRISGGQASGPPPPTHPVTPPLTPRTNPARASILHFARLSPPPPLALPMHFLAAPATR